jgi:hypothetical protein
VAAHRLRSEPFQFITKAAERILPLQLSNLISCVSGILPRCDISNETPLLRICAKALIPPRRPKDENRQSFSGNQLCYDSNTERAFLFSLQQCLLLTIPVSNAFVNQKFWQRGGFHPL